MAGWRPSSQYNEGLLPSRKCNWKREITLKEGLKISIQTCKLEPSSNMLYSCTGTTHCNLFGITPHKIWFQIECFFAPSALLIRQLFLTMLPHFQRFGDSSLWREIKPLRCVIQDMFHYPLYCIDYRNHSSLFDLLSVLYSRKDKIASSRVEEEYIVRRVYRLAIFEKRDNWLDFSIWI